jgi:cation:H+ antiporter
MLPNLAIFLLAFLLIWIGSGLAIKAVERVSRIMRVSSFMVSFIVLGFFTSVGELSVGVNAIIENDPEIFVGNLIGASIVIFMLIVPLLAITGNKIRVTKEFQGFNLPASLIVISLPVLLALDGVVSRTDALITIFLFVFLIVSLQARKGIMERVKELSPRSSVKIGKEMVKIVAGLLIIFLASKVVVDQTLYFSASLNISPFLISLVLISFGTNIPELSLVFRSVFARSNQVAFGDYVGSATFNTFLMGILALVYGKPVELTNSYVVSLLFLVVGLLAFYYFARTKNTISRLEGLALLGLYLLFLATEVFLHRGVFFN